MSNCTHGVLLLLLMIHAIILPRTCQGQVSGHPGVLNLTIYEESQRIICPVARNVTIGQDGKQYVSHYLTQYVLHANILFLRIIEVNDPHGEGVLTRWTIDRQKIYNHFKACYYGKGVPFYMCTKGYGGYCWMILQYHIVNWEQKFNTGESDRPMMIMDAIMFPPIFILGVIGNGLIIIAIIKLKSLQTPTNIFLTSMAFGDFLLIIVSLPFELIRRHFEYNVNMPLIVCKIMYSMLDLCLCVSSLHVVSLSFERFYAICKPMQVALNCTKRRAVIIGLIIWSIAIPYSSVFGIITTRFPFDDLSGNTAYICQVSASALGGFGYFGLNSVRMVVYIVLPFCILLHNYTRVSIVLWRSVKESARLTGADQKGGGDATGRIKVMKMLWAMFATFIVFYAPGVYNEWARAGISFRIPPIYRSTIASYILLNFMYLVSAINPVVYISMSRQMQKAIAQLIPCCRRFIVAKGSASSTSTLSSSGATGQSQVSVSMPDKSATA